MLEAPEPLPPYPNLPREWQVLAAFVLSCPDPNSDALLLLADALDEAAAAAMPPAFEAHAALIRHDARALASELRRRAPEYA